MIQTLAPQADDQSFRNSGLRPWRNRPVAYPHGCNPQEEASPTTAVIVPRQTIGADVQGKASVICSGGQAAIGCRMTSIQSRCGKRHDLATKLLRDRHSQAWQKALDPAKIETALRYAHVLQDEITATLERVHKVPNQVPNQSLNIA